jgi:hypothetical protein
MEAPGITIIRQAITVAIITKKALMRIIIVAAINTKTMNIIIIIITRSISIIEMQTVFHLSAVAQLLQEAQEGIDMAGS